MFDILSEDLYVLLDLWEVCKTFFLGVSFFVHSHISDSSVVNVSQDEALAFVWGEVRDAGFLHFAEHCECRQVSGLDELLFAYN